MKKFALLPLASLMVVIFGLAIPAQTVEAGHASYRSKITHVCSHCRQPVYAFYRPVRYINQTAVYAWVPASHSCQRSVVRVSPSRIIRYSSPAAYSTTTIRRSYSPRYYSTAPTRYRSLRTSPTLRYYRRSTCR